MADEIEQDEDNDTRRQMDFELKTMGAMLRLLRDLDPTARPRVVQWLADRYRNSETI